MVLVSKCGHKEMAKIEGSINYPTGTKNRNFVEDHPRNIPFKFGSNWPSAFGEEA
jgi:hypothetical protein